MRQPRTNKTLIKPAESTSQDVVRDRGSYLVFRNLYHNFSNVLLRREVLVGLLSLLEREHLVHDWVDLFHRYKAIHVFESAIHSAREIYK